MNVRRPDRWREGACSVVSADLDEPAYGTASEAVAWLALEQPGPWGRDAAQESHLDPALGATLSDRLKEADGRFVLVRSPGAHPDDHHGGAKRVLVAWCRPGDEWLLEGSVESPERLLSVDLAALARGDLDAVLASVSELKPSSLPQLLVCTNGRRDVCCAVRGRPLAIESVERRPGQVWETSHTGGHRFAPTGVLLPSGLTLARIDAEQGVAALDAAGKSEVPAVLNGSQHDRGRSGLPAPAQAAESVIRFETGETRLGALQVTKVVPEQDETWRIQVEHVDGRAWQLRVHAQRVGADRPASCLKPVEPQTGFSTSIVRSPESDAARITPGRQAPASLSGDR